MKRSTDVDEDTVMPVGGETNTADAPEDATDPLDDDAPGASTDPLDDIAKLRLSQNFGDAVGAKKLITTVPVRKPGRQDWVRVHPDPDLRIDVGILDWKEDREIFLVAPALHEALAQEIDAGRGEEARTRGRGPARGYNPRLPIRIRHKDHCL